jgi:hypothetical protein
MSRLLRKVFGGSYRRHYRDAVADIEEEIENFVNEGNRQVVSVVVVHNGEYWMRQTVWYYELDE